MNTNEQIDVLFVEDNQNDIELTLRAFKAHNLANKIHFAKDGAEALDFLFCEGDYKGRDIRKIPKVIILDVKLPKIDGKDVLIRLKSDERTKIIPVVVMTSSQEESDVFETYNFGANSYIVKPVNFDNFVDTIRQLGMYWLFINKPPIA